MMTFVSVEWEWSCFYMEEKGGKNNLKFFYAWTQYIYVRGFYRKTSKKTFEILFMDTDNFKLEECKNSNKTTQS